MTLKQLEAFYWAATCATFAMAAEKIHLSISSLSKRISELEATLGQQLFDRHGDRAVLSEVGALLLPRARALLMAAERMEEEIRSADTSSGQIRVGVGELTAMTWLARFMRRVQEERPRHRLEAIVDVGGNLEPRLAAVELDIAIVAAKSSNPEISSSLVSEAQFRWYSASGAAWQGNVRQGMFDHTALISLPIESGITRLVDDWLRARGIIPSRRIVCNHWGAIAGFIREGLGIGVLPQGWATCIAEAYGLSPLKCEPALPTLEYFIQWRNDDYRVLVT